LNTTCAATGSIPRLYSGSSAPAGGAAWPQVLRPADPHQRQPVGDARLEQKRAGDLGEAAAAGDEQGRLGVPHRLGDDRAGCR
jgi:hypothetical protein